MKMRSLRWTLIHYYWLPCQKGEFGHRDRLAQKENYVTHLESRVKAEERSDGSTSPGMPVSSSKPPEARRRAWNRLSLRGFRGANPAGI